MRALVLSAVDDVRLMDGENEYEGRVEVHITGVTFFINRGCFFLQSSFGEEFRASQLKMILLFVTY